MRRSVSAIALFLALFSPAIAAPPPAPKGPVDLSRARCESPKVIAHIKAVLPTMQVAGGRAFLSTFLGDNGNLTATTLDASKDQLDCRITVSFLIRGSSQTMAGKWTVRALPDGRIRESWDGGY
jgi:hypothetical protein